MEAVAQRPSEPLHAFNDVGAGEGVLAVPLDPFDDEVLDQSDEAAQAHGVETGGGDRNRGGGRFGSWGRRSRRSVVWAELGCKRGLMLALDC